MCPAGDKLGGNFVGFMAAAAGWGHLGVAGSALGTAVESQGPAAWVNPGGALGLGALYSSRTPPGCARRKPGRPPVSTAPWGWRSEVWRSAGQREWGQMPG